MDEKPTLKELKSFAQIIISQWWNTDQLFLIQVCLSNSGTLALHWDRLNSSPFPGSMPFAIYCKGPLTKDRMYFPAPWLWACPSELTWSTWFMQMTESHTWNMSHSWGFCPLEILPLLRKTMPWLACWALGEELFQSTCKFVSKN